MYQCLAKPNYDEKVEQIVSWTKTSLRSLEADDEAISNQIACVSLLMGRTFQDEAESKNALELLKSIKRAEHRKLLVQRGEKPTEKYLDDLVLQEPEVQENITTYNEMMKRRVVLEGLYQAITTSKRQFIERNKERINHDIKTNV
jgi:acetylornithine/succinyldiaminopimelate/putrescine aminotransferase